MFGFLDPHREDLRYRSVYARCCQHLRRHYGLRSSPFHSYEAVFLYACAMDGGLFPAETVPPQQCCRLAAIPKRRPAPDALVGRYCASVAVILADVKLADDIEDNPSWGARAYRRLLSAPVTRAYAFLRAIDGGAYDRIGRLLDDHARMEAAGHPVAIADYCVPTAGAFGFVYGLLGELSGSPSFRALATALGREVGSALIAYDCATDWEMDRASGNYNPIAARDGVKSALEYSGECLRRAEAECRGAFGEAALSPTILASVRERVLEVARNAEAPAEPSCLDAAVAAGQRSCATATASLRRQLEEGGLRPARSTVLYQDCGGGSACGGLSCGTLCALICCGLAIQSACGQNRAPQPERTGCGAQNTRTGCCGEPRQTTKIAGPCEVDNTRAATTCCKIGIKGCG